MGTNQGNDHSPLLPENPSFMMNSSAQLKPAARSQHQRNPLSTTQASSKADAAKVHSLYQDLYLTDLKNDLGEVEDVLSREKEKNLQLVQTVAKLKKELLNNKRTIANYRKIVTEM